ncbi:MAG: alpha/beta hydrolase [Eubacterium sp.]|nr:alpha/beta hydrolase [Eubacterium sp.]
MANPVLTFVVRRLQDNYKKNFGEQEVNDEIPADLEEFRDLPYNGRGGAHLMMDVYRPKESAGKKLPVIVMVHGGGLIVGSRKMCRDFVRILARKGYLVCVPDYRLIPEVDAFAQLSDVCAGYYYIEKHLADWGGDPEKVFLVSESAGSWLSVFSLAMKESEALQKAVGRTVPELPFRAMGCFSGMFYTRKLDLIGLTYPGHMYGAKKNMEPFRDMNPESKEVIDCLPPVFLETSDIDIVESYTLSFHKALKAAGKPCRLLHFTGNKELTHAFPALKPHLTESMETVDEMLEFFESCMNEETVGAAEETQ